RAAQSRPRAPAGRVVTGRATGATGAAPELAELAWCCGAAQWHADRTSDREGTTRMTAMPEHRPATPRSWIHDALAPDGEVTWSDAPAPCRLLSPRAPSSAAPAPTASHPGADPAVADIEQRADRHRGVDQPDVGIRLRKVAEQLAGLGLDVFREQPERVGVR